jgi:hypothetical protein
MNCVNCGIEILKKDVTEDGYYFCNNLCRYTWQKNGKPNPYKTNLTPQIHQNISNIDMDFSINPTGFENRDMRIRLSYFAGPRLYIDGKKLKPTKKKFLSRNREYKATSNFGKQVKLQLKHRILDFVPKLIIEEKEFRFVKPLTVWEYFWISIPMILLFTGGALGALIAGAASFSNSILMRKIKPVFLRYLFTGLTSLVALFFYVKVIGFIHPYISNIISPKSLTEKLKEESIKVNKLCPQFVDADTRMDSSSSFKDSKFIYYYTIPNKIKTELDIDGIKKRLRPQIITKIRNTPEIKFFRDNNITLVYNYFDKNNKKILSIEAEPSDYN